MRRRQRVVARVIIQIHDGNSPAADVLAPVEVPGHGRFLTNSVGDAHPIRVDDQIVENFVAGATAFYRRCVGAARIDDRVAIHLDDLPGAPVDFPRTARAAGADHHARAILLIIIDEDVVPNRVMVTDAGGCGPIRLHPIFAVVDQVFFDQPIVGIRPDVKAINEARITPAAPRVAVGQDVVAHDNASGVLAKDDSGR